MDINTIILWVVSAGIVLGGLDYILKNKFGLGEEFENGLKTLGPLALAMVGIISLAPVIGNMLKPIATPLLSLFGADPSMVASILALDMGGYPIAKALALTPSAAAFSGLIVASMLGATIVFSIPVALNIISKKDEIFFIKGLLAGIITIPIGAFIGGLSAQFPLREVFLNSIPVFCISLFLIMALVWFPRKTMWFVAQFGKLIVIVITVGLITASIEALTGFAIIPGMAPITEGLKIVGIIAIVLMGIFPLLKLARIAFKKQFHYLGSLLGINETSVVGMLASLANNIPMFHMMQEMDDKGKILNTAFMVSGAFLLGDHLGFVASIDKSMIGPVLLAKLTAALLAIPAALIIAKRTKQITEL